VTSLVPETLDGKAAIVAASESGYVWAFDAGGAPLWRTALGEPVRRLVSSGDTLVCAASGAGVVVLSRSGAVAAAAAIPAAVTDIIVQNGQCTARLADGSVCCVALGR
jgi:outer membrane protein assembly factor BamB